VCHRKAVVGGEFVKRSELLVRRQRTVDSVQLTIEPRASRARKEAVNGERRTANGEQRHLDCESRDQGSDPLGRRINSSPCIPHQ
jgi:hypothetical protein